MPDHAERCAAFRSLHDRPEPFVIPNPWDAGSARILAAAGFEALATTSAGAAFVLGRRDGTLTRDEALANAQAIVDATPLPVSADLENGYGDDPATVADTITRAHAIGLAGASVEDASGDPAAPIYPFDLSVARVAAAVQAARALPHGFMVTARAEGLLHGQPDLAEIIRRLRAFQDAGADVLYAPGLADLAAIRTVTAAVSRPVNVLAGIGHGLGLTVADLGQAGVRRISLGAALSRAALGTLFQAAHEMRDGGTFGFLQQAAASAEINAVMASEA